MITLSQWSKNGQVRIYINGLGGQRSAKIWIEQQATDCFGSTVSIRSRVENQTRSELGNLENDAERAINELAGKNVKLFSEVLSLVK